MKIIFNDGTELDVQKVYTHGGALMIKAISTPAEELGEIFQNPVKTQNMIVKDREDVIATYTGYVQFEGIMPYVGEILEVVQYRENESLSDKIAAIANDMETVYEALAELSEMIVGGE